jgi:hypothetical protein
MSARKFDPHCDLALQRYAAMNKAQFSPGLVAPFSDLDLR